MKLFSLFFLFTITLSAQQKQYAVFFDFDKASTEITPQVFEVWAQEHSNAEILKIYGYTDSVGTVDYNQKLSESRANYIMQQLKNNKVKLSKDLEVKGFGESQAFSEHTPYHRKVVFYYTEPEPVKQVEVTKDSLAEKSDFAKAVDASKKGDKIKVPNLNFYNDSYIVLPESQPILKDLLAIMQNNPTLKIQIHGHICCQEVETGPISRQRAEAIYVYLIRNGIDKGRLSYKSFGSTKPIYSIPEKNEAEKVINRRVEIEIISN